MSNQEIESIYHPGQVTTMLGLLKDPDDFSRSHGLKQLLVKDTTTDAAAAENIGFKTRQG